MKIQQRPTDGYINATKLATTYREATGIKKDISEWLKSRRTQETLNHLSRNLGIPVNHLYQVFRGAPETGGGTWLHPKLSIRFGMWLSDEFGLLVENKVEEWLRPSPQPAPLPAPQKTRLQVLAQIAWEMAEFERRQSLWENR